YEIGQRNFYHEHSEEMVAFYQELAEQVAGDSLTARQVAGIQAAVGEDIGEQNFLAGLAALVDGFWAQRAEPDVN
ncbi:MAG: hypothetical protein HQ526_02940, partial [Actinobacteria bacterium]|nr:hypothetical protein [Actinomycetota bacterium]